MTAGSEIQTTVTKFIKYHLPSCIDSAWYGGTKNISKVWW